MILRLALALLFALSGATALAQLRTIPPEAKRGEMRHVQDMIVILNGEEKRLSPGAQIRNPSNMVVLPTALPAGALVKYTLDATGNVHRVWILSPQEAAAPEPQM